MVNPVDRQAAQSVTDTAARPLPGGILVGYRTRHSPRYFWPWLFIGLGAGFILMAFIAALGK